MFCNVDKKTVVTTLTALVAAIFLGSPFLMASHSGGAVGVAPSTESIQKELADGESWNPEFKAPIRLKSEGKPIETFRNGACVGDFNGDGLKDLVFGVGAGIQVALNEGTNESPVYGKPTPIQIRGRSDVVRVSPGIGCSVQVVDFDHDGQLDILAGPVQPYLFRQDGNGTFTRSRLVSGDRFGAGRLTSFFATDWDQDGDFDLLHGNLNGRVILVENIGTRTSPRFATEYETIRSGDRNLLMVGGTSTPVHVDWDNDGKRDLIVGSASGEVALFPNIGSEANPRFGEPQPLISESSGFIPNDPVGPGKVSIPSVVDYDGDGVLDLVIGDQLTELPDSRGLSAPQKARFEELLAEYERIGEEQALILEAFRVRARDTEMGSAEFRLAFEEMRTKIQEIEGLEQWRAIASELTELGGKLKSKGRLWVYVRESQ